MRVAKGHAHADFMAENYVGPERDAKAKGQPAPKLRLWVWFARISDPGKVAPEVNRLLSPNRVPSSRIACLPGESAERTTRRFFMSDDEKSLWEYLEFWGLVDASAKTLKSCPSTLLQVYRCGVQICYGLYPPLLPLPANVMCVFSGGTALRS